MNGLHHWLLAMIFAASPVEREVSVYKLISQPADYYGEMIEFTGFLSVRSADSRFIWPTREDFLSNDRFRCIELSGAMPEIERREDQIWNLTYVRIKGVIKPNISHGYECEPGVLAVIESIRLMGQNHESQWNVLESRMPEIMKGPGGPRER